MGDFLSKNRAWLDSHRSGSFHVFDDSPEHINMEKAKLKNMFQGLRAYVYDAIDTAYKVGKDKGKENARSNEMVELPHPCDGEAFSDVRITEQITKIMSEVGEVSDANARYQKYGSPECRRDVLLELQDVIVAATTAQYIMGAELDERQRITREVNESNARRDNGARFKK